MKLGELLYTALDTVPPSPKFLENTAARIGAARVLEENGVLSLRIRVGNDLVASIIGHVEEVGFIRCQSRSEFGPSRLIIPGHSKVPNVIGQRIVVIVVAVRTLDNISALFPTKHGPVCQSSW